MVLDKLVYEFLIVCSIVIRIASDKSFTFSDNHDIISMKLYELESLKKVRLLDSRAQRFTVLF